MLAMILVASLVLFVVWLTTRRRTLPFPSLMPQRQSRRLQAFAFTTALLMFTIAAAGPRWGAPESVATATGHDIVVVVDISRSMTARDAMPDRIGRARELLQQIVGQLERRGGIRMAIVAFASQAHTVCPLTFDLGHVTQKVTTISADALPEAFAASAASGTRIGSALTHAAELLGESGGRILLLSDADDPARDGEWRRGLTLNIPIHVIAFGNPERDIAIPGITNATSRLQEGPLRELASQTGGRYIAEHNSIIDASYLNQLLSGSPPNTSELVVSRAPVKPAPFLIAGLLCLTLGLTGLRWRPAIITATAFAIAAAPIDDWLRRGNADLAAGRAESALAWYAKAAERTPDPGQVAFNQGVALGNLGRFRDAELHFRRSLVDAQGERRAKALFNLGTCLVRRCGGIERKALSDAVIAFQQAMPIANGEMANEITMNLRIAEQLLAQAPPEATGNLQHPSLAETHHPKPMQLMETTPATTPMSPANSASHAVR